MLKRWRKLREEAQAREILRHRKFGALMAIRVLEEDCARNVRLANAPRDKAAWSDRMKWVQKKLPAIIAKATP